MVNPIKKIREIRNSPTKHSNESSSGGMRDNPKYSKYSIGRYSFGEPTVLNWGEKTTLKIGNYCSIATGVTILLGGEHKTDWVTTFPFWIALEEFNKLQIFRQIAGTKGDVVIGNDVWIGTNATILSGVNIGDGAVIGACSVVTKDVPPYSIVAGNPAKEIAQRFDKETIDKLLKIRWWDWDIQRIKDNMSLLLSEKAKEFAEKNST